MADTTTSSGFITINDIVNNFIISYTGPGKLIPDSKRTEVVFHARRCLQEFAYETLKSQFTYEQEMPPNPGGSSLPIYATLPRDFVSIVKVEISPGGSGSAFTESIQKENEGVFDSVGYYARAYDSDQEESGNAPYPTSPDNLEQRGAVRLIFASAERTIVNEDPIARVTYLSNALTNDESAAIPKLAEEAMYGCMIYSILANRENTNPNLLQRLLIEKIDKLEKSKSRLVLTNFSS